MLEIAIGAGSHGLSRKGRWHARRSASQSGTYEPGVYGPSVVDDSVLIDVLAYSSTTALIENEGPKRHCSHHGQRIKITARHLEAKPGRSLGD